MGFSGLPTFSSILDSSYDMLISSFPYPLRWWQGSVRMLHTHHTRTHSREYKAQSTHIRRRFDAPLGVLCVVWGVFGVWLRTMRGCTRWPRSFLC